jgi:hypothetical protein
MVNVEETSNPTKIDFDKIFQKSTDQAVDFEIVFAGLLATCLLSVSGISLTLDLISVVGAISLLLFTMIRRMAVDNPFAFEKQLMSKSLTVIFATTVFSAVYFVVYPAEIVHNRLNVNYYLTISILLLVLVLIILLIYEYSFRDFFLWASILFYNRYIDSIERSTKNVLLLRLSKFSLSVSFTPRDEVPNSITNIHTPSVEKEKNAQKIYLYAGIILGIIIFIGLMFLIGNFVRWVITGELFVILSLIFLIISLTFLTGIVEFWFSRYGNARFKDLIDWKRRAINWSLAFFTVVVSGPDILNVL